MKEYLVVVIAIALVVSILDNVRQRDEAAALREERDEAVADREDMSRRAAMCAPAQLVCNEFHVTGEGWDVIHCQKRRM